MGWLACIGLGILISLTPRVSAGTRADPLEVPLGPAPTPELMRDRELDARIQVAEEALRERGVQELPVLAWALLEQARKSGDGQMIRRAVTLASHTPAVRFEAARTEGGVAHFVGALLSIGSSLPALVWLGSLLGAALGIGVLAAASFVVAVGFVRALPLLAHRLGHATTAAVPPLWIGRVVVLGAIAALAWLGLGPLLLLAVAGLLAAQGLSRKEGAFVVGALLILGLGLGPALDGWTRLAGFSSADPGALATWRVDREQSLPDDRTRLEAALARDPHDGLVRLGLALSWYREGAFERVQQILAAMPPEAAPEIRARAQMLVGNVRLAVGDVDAAVQAFERSQTFERGAPALYNLSQAHGRGLALTSQSTYFKEARQLEPDLIGSFALAQSSNVHRYLIRAPIPLGLYLKRVLRGVPEATRLARLARRRLLGAGLPNLAWLALPLLGLAGLLSPRLSGGRCNRCQGAICGTCTPGAPGRTTCAACRALLAYDQKLDAQIQQRRIQRDRQRRRHSAGARAALGMLLPGFSWLHEGHSLLGAVPALAATTGASFLLLGWGGPGLSVLGGLGIPFEVGGLGVVFPLLCAGLLLAPVYAWSLANGMGRLSAMGRIL